MEDKNNKESKDVTEQEEKEQEEEEEEKDEGEEHAPEEATEDEKKLGYVLWKAKKKKSRTDLISEEGKESQKKTEYAIGKLKFSFRGGLTQVVMLIALVVIVCWLMVSQIGVTRQVFNVNIENIVNTITQQTAKIQSLEQRLADFIK